MPGQALQLVNLVPEVRKELHGSTLRNSAKQRRAPILGLGLSCDAGQYGFKRHAPVQHGSDSLASRTACEQAATPWCTRAACRGTAVYRLLQVHVIAAPPEDPQTAPRRPDSADILGPCAAAQEHRQSFLY